MGRSSWCTTKWNIASDWCSYSSFVSECQNYGILNSGSRRTSYSSSYYYGYYCDSSLGPGWFRFQGSAGTRMATSCPSYRRCGTYSTGWLSGGHPSVADGQVTRTVIIMVTAMVTQQASKWEIVVHITCTILVVHLLVISVTVALTRHKCKQSLYVYIFYHFSKVGYIVKTQ